MVYLLTFAWERVPMWYPWSTCVSWTTVRV